jgi:hypothetical protein
MERLPATAQVELYGARLRIIPVPLDSTRAIISRQGFDAVPVLLAQVTGQRHALPRLEAVEILSYIQLRGCNLAQTRVPGVLEQLLIHEKLSNLEEIAIANCLQNIRDQKYFPPGSFDGELSPCERHQ